MVPRMGRQLAFTLCILNVVVIASQDNFDAQAAAEPNLLAESDFLWDNDGWTVAGNPNGLLHGSKMIKAADSDASIWYFVAPSKFVGAKRAAYRGKLSFRHGFFEYNSEGHDFKGGEFDVILESEAYELVVGWKNLIPAWAFRSDHELELDETAGWVLESTGGPPSRPDMVRLLSKLSSIKIRGGFYVGNEDAYLMSVRLLAGPQDTAPRKTSLKEQRILSADSQRSLYDTGSAQQDADTPPPPPLDDADVPPPPADEDVKEEL
mmetsp:Transcript_33084/g.68284  ORF Transcript_33084/g.68284 Transcript_33084/m.68284 type:complete len:264 (+) Transcript_33084:191-982(+)|eukprot:CAMPEP_0181290438 /NCGR_PEP_ID=MMETSP1101-20121128/1414_1 /TAXON_ID=46948 /ORGANISM="Rhodomonas abbreviata, Strain Caron Lab Isolate" /LENGTH=263 /DNA_ID=CAMNT_0023394723 /DNA_START=186 /DNA_END=977 /DNA_ORIENTATION=+